MALSITRSMKSMSIKLMAIVTLALVIAAGTVGIIGYLQISSISDSAITTSIVRRFHAVDASMIDQSQKALTMAIALADDPRIGEALSKGDRPALIAAAGAAFADSRERLQLTLFSFHSLEGKAIARVHAPDKFGDSVVSRRSMVADALKSGEVRFGLEPGLNSISVFGTVPTRFQGRIVGITDIGAEITPAFLKALKTLNNADIAMHLVKNGTVQTIGATFSQKTLLEPEIHQRAMQGLTSFFTATLDGVPVAVIAGPLKNYSGQPIGTIEVVMDRSTYVSARNESLWLLTSVFAAILLLGGLVAWALYRQIGKPIRDLNEVLKTLATGRYDLSVPGRKRQDEIGAIANSVEVLRQGAIERSQLQAQKLADEDHLRTRSAKTETTIQRFVSTVGSLVETVGANIGEMESTANSLTKMVQTTTKLATSADEASRQSTHNVNSVALASEQLAQSSTEIATKIFHTNEIVLKANSAATGANARIKSLVEASRRIGDVVELIRAIAAQTNLLALNATIEAARAGSAGRGFAVVASEVKALADQTAKATEEISHQIVSVQSETEAAVDAIEVISLTMTDAATLAKSVTSAIEQQREATTEISRNVQYAASGTETVGKNITAVTTTAVATNDAAVRMLDTTGDLKTVTTSLTHGISSFLAELRAI